MGNDIKQVKALIGLSDLLDRKDEIKAFVKDIRKDVELTDEQIAKQSAASEIINKADKLKSEFLAREKALSAKEDLHEKTVSDFAVEKEKYHKEVIITHENNVRIFEEKTKRFYEVTVPNFEAREAKFKADIEKEDERRKEEDRLMRVRETAVISKTRENERIATGLEEQKKDIIKVASR